MPNFFGVDPNPDYAAIVNQAILEPRMRELAKAQADAQLGAIAQAAAHAKAAQAAEEAYMANPTPENLARYGAYNKQAFETIKAAHDMKDADVQRQDLRDWTALNGMMGAGDWDGAIAMQERRIAADKKAGQDTSDDEHALELMRAKNPAALAMARAALYGVLGPDKYTAAVNANNATDKLPSEIAASQANAELAHANAKKAGYETISKDQALIPLPGSAPLVGGTAADSAPPFNPNAPKPTAGFVDKLIGSESDGDPAAKNPRSTATGAGQFINATWLDMVKTHRPDLAQGKSDGQILALRKDASLSREMVAAYAEDNTPTLEGAGIAANAMSLAMAHKLGPQGAVAVFHAAPDAKLENVLPANVIKANPHLKGKTALGYAQQLAQEFGTEAADLPQRGAAPAVNLPPGSIAGPGFLGTDAPESAEAPLSDEAVAMVGEQYLRLGPSALQNLGQGKTGVANKNKILSWAARQAKEAGTTNAELVLRHVQNKANIQALGQTQKMLSAVTASEQTLSKNLDLALDLAKKGGLGPTGVPVFDTPLNKLRVGSGSEAAKSFDNARITVANEYAKILSSTTGTGGVTSDSAREEAQNLFPAGMNLRQFVAAVGIAKQEAANRHASLSGEVARLGSDISGKPAPAEPAAAPPPAAPTAAKRIKFDAKGNVIK